MVLKGRLELWPVVIILQQRGTRGRVEVARPPENQKVDMIRRLRKIKCLSFKILVLYLHDSFMIQIYNKYIDPILQLYLIITCYLLMLDSPSILYYIQI